MAVSQVQAVVNAVTEVLGDDFVAGTTVVSEALTSEQKKQVRDLVKKSILAGEVNYSGDTQDVSGFNRYVNGMINNHLMRSKKLNGGVPYTPSKKGAPRDPQLKEFSKLLKTLTPGTEEYIEVANAYNERKAELSTPTPSHGIDTSILPSGIASMVSQAT